MLRDQVATLVDRAKSQGANVESRVHPDMIHNWHMLASTFRSGQDAIDEIGAFVRRVTMTKTAAR
jgi:acetyl esterase/lipase